MVRAAYECASGEISSFCFRARANHQFLGRIDPHPVIQTLRGSSRKRTFVQVLNAWASHVTNFLAVAELAAVADICATLPSLICRRLMHDPRLKILPAPVDLGSFPVEMAWHVRYRHDPAHRWLRALIGAVITDLTGKTAAAITPSPA